MQFHEKDAQVTGVTVKLFSLDGQHWDSNIVRLQQWHRERQPFQLVDSSYWNKNKKGGRAKSKTFVDYAVKGGPGDVDNDLTGLSLVQTTNGELDGQSRHRGT